MLKHMHDLEPNAKLPTHQKAILQTVVYKRVRDIVNRLLKTHGINTTQWMVLGILHDKPGGQKISDIAHLLQVEVPLITTLSQALLREHYVTQSADAQDRRSKPLAITDKGQQLIASVESQLSERLNVLEVGLSDEALTAYFTTLQTFIANAERADAKLW